jgi:hypothetical protein
MCVVLTSEISPIVWNVVRQISTIISISVTIAMYCLYCLVQLYFYVAKELAPHRPVLKSLSVKAVGAVDSPYR